MQSNLLYYPFLPRTYHIQKNRTNQGGIRMKIDIIGDIIGDIYGCFKELEQLFFKLGY